MTNKRLYMDVHVIQVLPPSNINRDDTGSPKTAQYGGVRRARVSSQAWKRAMRGYFHENSPEAGVGVRTKDIVSYVAKKVVALVPEMDYDTAFKEAENALNNAGISTTKDHVAKALFFMGNRQAEMLAKAIVDGKYTKNDKKELQQILADNPEIDIALFGRMVADDPKLNTDAACQVAHAISTHAVQTEFDYYTAMDDLSPEDQSGAGMLGNIEYNSSTLYRYANIAVHEFTNMLGDEASTVAACKLFIEAFSNSMPTGKINTFANQTLPSFVMVTLREDRPVNLVSAFEKPVQVRAGSGYVNRSIEKLAAEYEKTGKFVDEPLGNFFLNVTEQSIDGIGETCDNLKDLLQKAGQKIESCLKEAGDLN
ncbi:MAG: type I-E CRISPR-associated protein Cas7/Cse4/CasC [Clostridiales bacterium]|nr:type I-E CRISPR-associated protein Cas7/Cse4/CasC [Clostridiales bacterium]